MELHAKHAKMDQYAHAPASRETPFLDRETPRRAFDAEFRNVLAASLGLSELVDDDVDGYANVDVDMDMDVDVGVGNGYEDEDEDEDYDDDYDDGADAEDANDGMRTPPRRVSYVNGNAFRAFCENNFGEHDDVAADPDEDVDEAANAALSCARVLTFE